MLRAAVSGMLSVALLAVAAGPAGASTQPGPDFFGVNVEPMIKMDSITSSEMLPESAWSGYLATMAGDGLTVARSDAEWDWVEPTAPPSPGDDSFDWNNTTTVDGDSESMDQLVGLLAKQGIRYVPVLDSAPSWAGENWNDQLTPTYYQDYANYAGAFAARYGPNGTYWQENAELPADEQVPYLPVEQYEIWTEANSTYFWTGEYCGGYGPDSSNPDADMADCESQYAQGLSMASAAIHAVDPSATVLASIGWQNFEPYLEGLYQDLAADNAPTDTINGIAMHPYGVDAVSILQLDEQLRETLDTIATAEPTYGAGGLPIYDTEDGQPVVSSGQGADYSYEGYVTDGARAAMVSLAGDALARSDCGVQDYLIYGLVGSGVSTADGGEPNDEGLMGIFSLSGDQPNLTGTALIDSQASWVADPSSNIVLCGTGTTPTADLLPLGIQVTNTSPTCASATVTYGGNPIEGANLILQAGSDTVSTSWPHTATNAHGQTSLCLDSGAPPLTSYSVYAELSTNPGNGQTYDVAISPTWTCPESSAACVSPNAPAAAPQLVSAPSPAASPVAPTYKLYARILRINKHGTKLRVQLHSSATTATSGTLTVWLKRRKHHRTHLVLLSKKTLSTAGALKFRVSTRLHKGQHLVLRVAADSTIDLPKLSRTLTAH